MTTGKVAYVPEPDEIEIRTHDVPDPEHGAVLTTVERSNVCGSDHHIVEGRLGDPFMEMVLGHEALCRIDELGAGVDTDSAGRPVEAGDLVAPVYYRTCQRCAACARGEHYNCENSYSHKTKSLDEFPHFHGTYSTHYYIHSDQHFYKIPEVLKSNPGVAAAANCALSQVMFGLDQVGVEYDEWVVIQGAGGLGLNAIAYAREQGAKTIVVEGRPERIERARSFGADHVVDMREYDNINARIERVHDLTDGGADVGVEVAGVPAAFTEGVELLREGGRYLELGNINPGSETMFDPGRITRRSIEVTALVQYDPGYLDSALRFLAQTITEYPYDELVDAVYGLDEVEEALDEAANGDLSRPSIAPHQ